MVSRRKHYTLHICEDSKMALALELLYNVQLSRFWRLNLFWITKHICNHRQFCKQYNFKFLMHLLTYSSRHECEISTRAIGSFENPGGQVVMWWAYSVSLPNSGKAMAPSTPRLRQPCVDHDHSADITQSLVRGNRRRNKHFTTSFVDYHFKLYKPWTIFILDS